MSYSEYWDKIFQLSEEMTSLVDSYWNSYSGPGSWQFWAVAVLLVLPLVLLYFTVDRKRIFEIFFFGFIVHALWTYTDIVLGNYTLLVHTYYMLPIFPHAFNITMSVLPVGFMLIYQYCTSHRKNFILYTVILSAVYSLVFASIEKALGMVELNKGMNLFYLFLIDLVIAFIAYIGTRLVRRAHLRADAE
ncbi:CBO0543 family protein [Bacillus infantis]|uniref:CBO0543 family protein n=1 Tax=Bacillus infantis TaxID=324767 RepID=UPI003CEC387F